MRGDGDLSAHILRGGLDAGFDLAFSNELRIDHSITCPIITLRPQADLPIVPVYTNIFAPPLPQPKRFVELGRLLRELVESWPSDQRVAIIGTGHLSLELGGPRQFGPHGPDPEFDRKAVEWIANGDLEGCLRRGDPRQPARPGNATHGFMDFMLMMGVAGEDAKADYVDTLDLFHTMEAYFTWYPNGAPRHEQVPGGQVPLHRRPRPRPRGALPRGPGGHRRVVGGGAGQRDPELPRARGQHLARLRRRRARRARRARPRRRCSSWAPTRSSR